MKLNVPAIFLTLFSFAALGFLVFSETGCGEDCDSLCFGQTEDCISLCDDGDDDCLSLCDEEESACIADCD